MTRQEVLKKALELADIHTPTAKWAAFVDFTVTANNHRFFLIDLKNRSIAYSWYTSHGSGSGARDGKWLTFSNRSNSHMSSTGLYLCAETYWSNKFNGLSLRLDGQTKQQNTAARGRAVVMHPSTYVSQPYMRKNKFPGRSWGCVTLDPAKSEEIVKKLANGSILYVQG